MSRHHRERPNALAALPRARKRFGQHFLEPAWITRLIATLGATPDDTFLEIGPGRGALTRPLAAAVGRLVCVEIDRDLAALLRPTLPANTRLVEADFLDLDVAALLRDERLPVRVAGNLPYNVGNPIIFRLLDAADGGSRLRDATLMLQKEVADRLLAAPGDGDYGALTVQVALRAKAEHLMTLPPGAFRPPPKVTSALVRLTFHPPAAEVGNLATFERVVRGVFLQRRKTILNALKPVADSFGTSARDLLDRAGVDPAQRPGDLALDQLAALARAVL
jgi:16S rRNA (adenine1518-N6/adenine1519-N6)-dimethyltransferase